MVPAATFGHFFGFENLSFLARQLFFFLMRNLAEHCGDGCRNLKITLPPILIVRIERRLGGGPYPAGHEGRRPADHAPRDKGRMSSATLANGDEYTYGYNAMGFRTVKQLPGAGQSEDAVIYMRDPQGRLMGEFDAQDNTQEEIVWLGDMPLAVVARTGAISSNIGYIFADQINAPRAVVNSQDNSLLWSWFQTDPFGRVEPNNNPQGLGVYDFDMRLPGQVHDNETGLDHNNARDYDPAIGRFVQPDPTELMGGKTCICILTTNL